MPTPWLSWPRRLDSTRCSATLAASTGELPPAITIRLASVSSLVWSMIIPLPHCGGDSPRDTHNAGSSASSYSFLKRLINSPAPTTPATLPTPWPDPQISFHALGLARSPEASVLKLILEGSDVGRLSGSMPAATIDGFR